MKSKYKNVEEALQEIQRLNENHIGWYYKILSQAWFAGPGMIGCSPEVGCDMYHDTDLIIPTYEKVKLTKKEKKDFLKEKSKSKSKRVKIPGYLGGDENFKWIEVKQRKPKSNLTLPVINKLQDILEQFPHDFVCVWNESVSEGESNFSLYYLQMHVVEMKENKIVLRFLEKHCKTTAKEKVIALAKELGDLEKNKEKLEFFGIAS